VIEDVEVRKLKKKSLELAGIINEWFKIILPMVDSNTPTIRN
jgi:hypothetical protein